MVDGVIKPVAPDKDVEQFGGGPGRPPGAGSTGDGADGVQCAARVEGDGVGGELGRSERFQTGGEERGGEVFGVEGDDGAGTATTAAATTCSSSGSGRP